MTGDAKEPGERQGLTVEPEPAGLPGFAVFDGSGDESLVDAMLELKISDRLRTLSRYADAVARFRQV